MQNIQKYQLFSGARYNIKTNKRDTNPYMQNKYWIKVRFDENYGIYNETR